MLTHPRHAAAVRADLPRAHRPHHSPASSPEGRLVASDTDTDTGTDTATATGRDGEGPGLAVILLCNFARLRHPHPPPAQSVD